MASIKSSQDTPSQPIVTTEMPALPVRDTVLFPHMVAPLFVGREKSVKAIEDAMAQDRQIVVMTQKQPETQDVQFEDVFTIGTEATIGRVLKMPDGTTSVLVQGQRRVRLLGFTQEEGSIRAKVTSVDETTEKTTAVEALMRAVLAIFEKCVKLSRNLQDEAYVAAMNVDDPGWLADLIASSLQLTIAQRQEILETLDAVERLDRINTLLAKELDVLELENKIQNQVQQEVDKTQREYFLREQMKAIQQELGETDSQTREINQLRECLAAARMPEEVAKKAEEELSRLALMPMASPEVSVIRTYIDWLVALPWQKETEDNLDIKRAAQILEDNHYGLDKIKERILEYMAVRQLAKDNLRSPILCFVGPPGVGKTSLGKSIAQAMGRKFVRISLGGIRDEAEIRGHRRTYVGAMPGRIIQAMRTAGTINPVYMLDEIDKVGMDFRGDPSAALLEVLDPEQNLAFSDHYLDVPFNLSKVMFVTTANFLDPVPPALRDRMEVIELPGYVEEEKLQIARKFLVPRQLKEHGLNDGKPAFSEEALRLLVREYTHEAGVRNLEREIGSICRKIAKGVVEHNKTPHSITKQALPKYLGISKYMWGSAEEHDEIGVATGVYWTPAGGDLATVESTLMEGKGTLILTGQLGDVMRESASAAMSYIRANATRLGITDKFYETQDIHIHLPAGAVPKDGPSAGITMATALISALTRRKVRRDVAMTGEITLRGRVLPIGGLKEKVLAAHRAGIKTFILPKRNLKDMTDIPANVRRELQFVYVDQMDEVIASALLPLDTSPDTTTLAEKNVVESCVPN